jgi:hypothetical protein
MGFTVLNSWAKKTKIILFYDKWKSYEIQTSASMNKLGGESRHTCSHTRAAWLFATTTWLGSFSRHHMVPKAQGVYYVALCRKCSPTPAQQQAAHRVCSLALQSSGFTLDVAD